MKIRLLKPWKNPAGRELPVGKEFTVDNTLGRQMIKDKTAKEVKLGIMQRFRKKKNADPEEEDNKGL